MGCVVNDELLSRLGEKNQEAVFECIKKIDRYV